MLISLLKLTSASRKPFLILSLIALTAACGGKNKSGNFYDSGDNDTPEVQMLGDSYIDYGNGNLVIEDYEPYIPASLIALSTEYSDGKIYRDRSHSGKKIGDVIEQFESAYSEDMVTGEGDFTHQVKTLIINGGANNLRVECVKRKVYDSVGGVAVRNDAYDNSCIPEFNNVKDKIARLFCKIDKGNITATDPCASDVVAEPGYVAPAVVWLGRYYLDSDLIDTDLIDEFNDYVKGVCNTYSHCYFVETRGAWSPQNANNHLLTKAQDRYVEDGFERNEDGTAKYTHGIHVTKASGDTIANLLWDVLEGNALVR